MIGEIKAEMARKGMTSTRLGELTEHNQQYWSRRFTGATPFDVDDLALLASTLQVPMWRFMPVERPGTDDPRGLRYITSPLSDSNRRPPLYIVDTPTDWAWPLEAPKRKTENGQAA